MLTLVKRLLGRRPRSTPPPAEPAHLRRRREIARKYLRGSGIEVGALHSPLPLPPGAKVTYVDRLPVSELRTHYPELAGVPLTRVDVVDDGERLGKFADASHDFVIANHFLEHTQDPIGTLKAHLRVVKPGGCLYLVVPNRHYTFDRDRPPTPWEHVLRDHREGPDWSYEAHIHEFAEVVDHCTGPDLVARIDFLRSTRYSIHFHVWNDVELRRFYDSCREECGLPCTFAHFENLECEILCVLRKIPGA